MAFLFAVLVRLADGGRPRRLGTLLAADTSDLPDATVLDTCALLPVDALCECPVSPPCCVEMPMILSMTSFGPLGPLSELCPASTTEEGLAACNCQPMGVSS